MSGGGTQEILGWIQDFFCLFVFSFFGKAIFKLFPPPCHELIIKELTTS